ncbi:MAG: NVEALA domain-containing protein [Tannerellaceae bacterium]|nr:NVEALA domain-containing protein [Tannerellaceae bacterium]
MKKFKLLTVLVVFILGGGLTMYQPVDEIDVSSLLLQDIEALAGCEVSSDSSQNQGYCVRNYGGSGDSCVSNGDGGSVRCSGNS